MVYHFSVNSCIQFEHFEVRVNEVEFTVVMNQKEMADLMVEKSCKHYLLKCTYE